ncbi:MAG: sulfatase-like hydrolase/transferase [Bacteroidales bacterium]
MKTLLSLPCLIFTANLVGQQPNVVLIISDDQSFNSIGYTSNQLVYTPTIDQLAKDGMIFTNAHHPVTVCSPSRYSMLTGKYSGRCEGKEYLARFPLGTLTRTENNCELTLEEENIGSILQANGYATGYVGKSHVMEHAILNTGNWTSYGLQTYSQTADPYDPEVSAKMRYNHSVYQSIVRSYGFDYADGIYMGNVKELHNDALNVHNLEWTVDKARKFIEQEKDNPFFLLFATTLHHGPVPWANKDGEYWSSFDADPKLTGEGYIDTTWDFMPTRQEMLDKCVAAGYPKNTAYTLLLDEGINAIYDKIKELNLEENTLIIYIPDHGMWRHGKATLHDFGLKVPMFMYWKGNIITGTVYDGLIQTVDFLPTILDIVGIEQPDGHASDGISLKSIIETGSGTGHTSLFSELGYSRAVKTKDWKYIAIRYPEDVQEKIDNGETFTAFDGGSNPYPYLTRNSHLGYHAARNNPHYFEVDQLYDLSADSAETMNVIEYYPEVVRQMRDLLSEYLITFENRPFAEFTLTETNKPYRAHSPVPKNGATNVKGDQVLNWTSEYNSTSHDVYFGTTNPPPLAGNQTSGDFNPGLLSGNTTYYWRIDEKNQHGTTQGNTWTFTTGSTLAEAPQNPFPEYNAAQVRKNTVLHWNKSDYASYYKVYFGIGEVEHVADVYKEEYEPGYLKSNSVCFWRIDAVNHDGVVTTGTPWAFTTGYGNIAPEATVTVSSIFDNTNFDGQNVIDGIFLTGNIGEWKSDGESTPWLDLKWAESAVVDKVHLYDRVGSFSQIIEGTIDFSDGSSINTGTLPSNGSKKTFEFSPREISSLKLSVREGIGEIGLSEIEVYDTVMYTPNYVFEVGSSDFSIFPNPVPGKQVTLSGLSESEPNTVYIYRIDGKLFSLYKSENKELQIDLSNFKDGIYFIRVYNERYDTTKKLIIRTV